MSSERGPLIALPSHMMRRIVLMIWSCSIGDLYDDDDGDDDDDDDVDDDGDEDDDEDDDCQ